MYSRFFHCTSEGTGRVPGIIELEERLLVPSPILEIPVSMLAQTSHNIVISTGKICETSLHVEDQAHAETQR